MTAKDNIVKIKDKPDIIYDHKSGRVSNKKKRTKIKIRSLRIDIKEHQILREVFRA